MDSKRLVVLVLLVVLSPLLAAAQSSEPCSQFYVYVNGVGTTRHEAEVNRRVLERRLQRHISETVHECPAPPAVWLNYNESEGFVDDVYQSWVQLVNDPDSSTLFWLAFYRLADSAGGGIVFPSFEEALARYPFETRDIQAELDEHLRLYQAVLGYYPIVVLAHSQGNLFANAAHDQLGSPPQNEFRIVSVATPAPSVRGDGPYTKVVNDVLTVVPFSLAPNIDSRCSLAPWDCHGMEHYLNTPKPRRRILNHLTGGNDSPTAVIDMNTAPPQFDVQGQRIQQVANVQSAGGAAAVLSLTATRSTDLDGREVSCSELVPGSCVSVAWSFDAQTYSPSISGEWVVPAPSTSVELHVFRAFPVGTHRVTLLAEDDMGARSEATLIVEVESAGVQSPGVLSFGQAQYVFSERSGAGEITIVRRAGSAGAVFATVAAIGGSAGANDYTGLPQTIVFADGDVAPKVVRLGIRNDGVSEPDETLELRLTAGGGATAEVPSVAEITIRDDGAVEPTSLLFAEGIDIVQMALDGTIMRRLPLGRAAAYFDIAADHSRIVYSDNSSQIWTYDVSTGQSTAWLSAPWSQTLRWVPGSSSRFIHGASNGNLYVFDTLSGTSALWQSSDTARAFAKNVYRGGLAFAASESGRVVARIGVAGAGGDGVFVGDICQEATHSVCNLQPVSNPAGSGTSWSTVAYGPSLTNDGRYAYYGERLAMNTHRIMRKDLVTNDTAVVYQTSTSGLDTGFGNTALFGEDRYLVFADINANGDRGIRVCDLGFAGGSVCGTVNGMVSPTIQTPGAFGGSIVVPVTWP